MTYASVCSGIEAATAAWHHIGWKPVWFAEIDPFCKSYLKHHYPEVPNLGEISGIRPHWMRRSGIPTNFDVLVGGTPCQAFSVAGKRKGMDDERGQLTLEYIRIARAFRPSWLVWENVPGVLSIETGTTFARIISLLAGYPSSEIIQVPEDGWGNSGILAQCHRGAYGIAWRVLDAQYFGVPQRRRRVFIVGHIGDWRSAAAVLFERDSLSGNPAPSREARQDVTGTFSARSTAGGGLGTDFDLGGGCNRTDSTI